MPFFPKQSDDPPPLFGRLYRVTGATAKGGGFCCGLIEHSGVVIYTAPILGWARGRQVAWLAQYCGRRRWRLERITKLEQTT